MILIVLIGNSNPARSDDDPIDKIPTRYGMAVVPGPSKGIMYPPGTRFNIQQVALAEDDCVIRCEQIPQMLKLTVKTVNY